MLLLAVLQTTIFIGLLAIQNYWIDFNTGKESFWMLKVYMSWAMWDLRTGCLGENIRKRLVDGDMKLNWVIGGDFGGFCLFLIFAIFGYCLETGFDMKGRGSEGRKEGRKEKEKEEGF